MASSAAAQQEPLAGRAWSAADEAYKAYDARNFSVAVERAREAVQLRPDLVQLRLLLVNTLSAQGDVAAAFAEANRAVQDNVADVAMIALRETLRGQLDARRKSTSDDEAYKAADAGYKAYARRDFAAAIAQARQAISLDATRPNYRSLLIDALQRSGRVADAEREAGLALQRFPANATFRLQRGYLRQALKRHEGAAADFAAAMTASSLSAAQRRSARLSLADVWLAAGRPASAIEALAPFGARAGYDVAIRRGYAFQTLRRQDDALAAFETAARQAQRGEERAAATRGIVAALVALDRIEEARIRFVEAYRAGVFAASRSLDIAYLANQTGETALAHELFLRADSEGQLRGQALLDAAYTAHRQADNEAAIAFFKRAIDAQHAGQIRLDPQRLFEVRRAVATISRQWGATASLIYGGVGVMPNTPISLPTSGSTLQAGAEVWWRPPGIGYRNGATFDIFARAFETLYDRTGGPTGSDTVQGTVGARWKPFSDFNLVFEAGRLFRVGRIARNDWQLRAAYSAGEGADLRRDTDHWRYWQIYAEVSRFLETAQTLAAAELRFGHSFLVTGLSPNLIVTPFAAVGAAYDSTLATPAAFGAGPGLNARYWFREDRYTAPMSYVDLNVQYRLRLGGDKRAEGWFASAAVNY